MKQIIKAKFQEYGAMFAALLLFFIVPYIVRFFDPTAGSFDAGMLQNIAYTAVTFAVYQAIVWSVNQGLWPTTADYLKSGQFKEEFYTKITPFQRICVTLSLYFALFFSLVLLSRSLFEMKH